MQRRSLLYAVVLSLALLPAAAHAIERPVKFGFGGGASVPVSDAKDAFQTGFHGKAMVMWNAPVLPLAVRGSVGYERFDLKSLTPGTSGNGRILSGLANVSWGFPVGPVKPYIIAGLGAFSLKTEVSGTSSPSETKFGIDGGAGLEFSLGPITGFVEGKVQNIFTDQGLGSTQSFDTLIVPVTLGVFF